MIKFTLVPKLNSQYESLSKYLLLKNNLVKHLLIAEVDSLTALPVYFIKLNLLNANY